MTAFTASTDSRSSAVPTPDAPTALDVGRAGEDLIADLDQALLEARLAPREMETASR